MLEPSRFSAVGRPLDPAYPTNRVVLGLIPLALVLVAGWMWAAEGATVVDALWAGVAAALALFGSWALARELDPDAEGIAFVAAGFGVGGWLVLGGALAPLFLALVLARIVNRTTGLAARPLDSVVLFAATLAVIWLSDNPLFGLVAAVAFGLDAALEPQLARHRYYLLASLLAVPAFHFSSLASVGGLPGTGAMVFMGLGALAVLALLRVSGNRRVDAVGDATGLPLSPRRVNAALLVVLAAAVAASLGGEGQGHSIWIVLAVVGGRLLGPGARGAASSARL